MKGFSPDLLMLVVITCAIPALIIFFRKCNRDFTELAQHYNGSVYRPYLGMPMGVEIPFQESSVIFDPYGMFMDQRKNNRTKRSALVWNISRPIGPKAISIERSGYGFRIRQLALAKKVKTNDMIFDQEFDILCRDEPAALEFLTSELRELLLAKRDIIYTLEIEGEQLIARHKDVLRHGEQCYQFIDEAMDLVGRIHKLTG